MTNFAINQLSKNAEWSIIQAVAGATSVSCFLLAEDDGLMSLVKEYVKQASIRPFNEAFEAFTGYVNNNY